MPIPQNSKAAVHFAFVVISNSGHRDKRIVRAQGFYPCLVLSVHKIGARGYEHSSVMSHNPSASTSKMTSETGGPKRRHQCRGGRCLNGAAHVARCRPGAGDVARYGLGTANIAR